MIQDYPNFEIIVSDDCSDDNSVQMVRELMQRDSRIKLFAHERHLGMRDNFEFALNQVRPGYVMALGGDDGLIPGCIWRMYEILSSTGRELLTWAPAGFTYQTKEDGSNIFYVKRKKNNGVRYIKSEDFLNSIADTFYYLVDECPMFYVKGVASTALVERVKSRTKDHSFYYCPTPDGFSGVVLAGEVEDYAYTNQPLSIAGDTQKSQGRNYGRIDEKSKKESQEFFNDNVRRTMHSQLASQQYSPLITLMTADYLLTAKDLPGWPGKFTPFTFDKLLRKTFKFMETLSYENDVLVRELGILEKIAEQHGLTDLYNSLLATTDRKLIKRDVVYGFAITHSIRLDGSKIGIHNIYDASLAVNFLYNTYNRFSLSSIFLLLKNNVKIVLRDKLRSKTKLPQTN